MQLRLVRRRFDRINLWVPVTVALWLAWGQAAWATSPPCSLTPLWKFQDIPAYSLGPPVSDSAGNVYLLRQGLARPHDYQVLSLDQNGKRRFVSTIASGDHPYPSGLALIGDNVLVVVGTSPANGATLMALRSSDGSIAWTHDLVSDLQRVTGRPILSVGVATPARGNGYVAVPLSVQEALPDGTFDARGAVLAYHPATGGYIGALQNAPIGSSSTPQYAEASLAVDESGNIYSWSRFESTPDAPRLTSWTANGTFRYQSNLTAHTNFVSGLLGLGSGLLMSGGVHYVGPFQLLRTSNGDILGSSSDQMVSPFMSGNRLTLLEDWHRLTAYDIPTSSLLWSTELSEPGKDAYVTSALITSVGSVVFLQHTYLAPEGESYAIREFDARGNEYVTCDIPGFRGTDFTLAGNRFVLVEGGTVWGFDAFGHRPAARGWVMQGGSPQGDMRPR